MKLKNIYDCLHFLFLPYLAYLVVYGPSSCTGLFYKLFFSIYVKEIKIATGDDVLSNSWVCLVNWHLGIFGPRPGRG